MWMPAVAPRVISNDLIKPSNPYLLRNLANGSPDLNALNAFENIFKRSLSCHSQYEEK